MIKIIKDKDIKSEICLKVLRDLPEWFGIEEALLNYVDHVQDLFFASYELENEVIGFVALEENPVSYDMHVLGLLKAHHRKGIGEALVVYAEQYAKQQHKKYMTVKTLSADSADINYKKTRLFYEALGYEHLEVFKTLWDEHNPCLYMIKTL